MIEEPKPDNTQLIKEHYDAHRGTLEVLKETDEVLEHAQSVISEARIRLHKATEKYQERLHGPTNPQYN
jgi:UTP:GlnB (protein PII) uridylyltransferase